MNLNEVEILLVEDNPYDAELATRALQKSKITNKIYHVKDGEEALDFLFNRGDYKERVNAKRPKVILLDLKMPKVSGLEVLKSIKANENTRTIPVVVLTSSKEEQDIIESYNLGVNSYIVKPVEVDKFFKAISDLEVYWLLLNQVPA
jgi:two-component system, response regulator